MPAWKMSPRFCRQQGSLFKMTQSRLDYTKTAPDGLKAMFALEQYVRHSELEPALLELVKMRASQINGCAWTSQQGRACRRRNGAKALYLVRLA
jgi:alkylhydroperoxidase family enzyme